MQEVILTVRDCTLGELCGELMPNDIIFPKTYLDRSGLSARSKYLFVSYSHKSSDVVYKDLSELYDKGLNYWYDTELKSGEVWFETVESKFADPNLCGAIFFFDINCLMGDAIEKEIELYEKFHATRPELFAFCVISEQDGSVYGIVRNAFIRCADKTIQELQSELPESRIVRVLSSFNKDKLYKLRKGNYIDEIIEDVRKHQPSAICDGKTTLNRLKEAFGDSLKEVNGNTELSFGHYPTQVYGGNEYIYFHNQSQTLTNGDRVLNCASGNYVFKPIEWVLLNVDNDEAVLVSKHIIDVCEGEVEQIEQWLKVFYDTAFDEEEKRTIACVELLSLDAIEKLEGKMNCLHKTKYAEDKYSMSLPVWLSEINGAKRKTLCGFNDGIGDIDFDYIDSYGGIMPIMKIKIK